MKKPILIPFSCSLVCVTVLLAAGTSSCGPAAEVTGIGPFEIPVERHRQVLHHDAVHPDERKPAIEMVKDSFPAEWGSDDGALAASLVDGPAGRQILFPRWTSVRTAVERYSVHFVFTSVEPGGGLIMCGYAWPVDLTLQVVGDRRILTAEEIANLTSRGYRPVRVREPTYDLE